MPITLLPKRHHKIWQKSQKQRCNRPAMFCKEQHLLYGNDEKKQTVSDVRTLVHLIDLPPDVKRFLSLSHLSCQVV